MMGGFERERQSGVEYLLSVVLCLVCILSACSNPSPGQTATGELVFADYRFPNTANPLFASSDMDLALNSALWGQPVFFDQHFRAHPDQLTEVPLPENGGVQDGGKTIIMHLRNDLRWSDGRPLVASDFQYWWRLNQDHNTGATITGGYDAIASIELPDQFTVILHMKYPSGPYLLYLPYAAPEHAWGHLRPLDLQNTPAVIEAPQVTSGPYKLFNRREGQDYTLVPNTYYTSTTFRGPFISRLTYQAYKNIHELSQAVRSRQADVSQGYKEYELSALAKLPEDIHVLEVPTAAYEHLTFNLERPFLRDVRVRQAIQMAIDTCSLIKTVLHTSDCARRATQVEPPPSLYANPTIKPARYDPDEARKVLAQSGWQPNTDGLLTKDGRPLTLHLATTEHHPLRAATAREIQRYLRAVGIQVTITYHALNTFFDDYTSRGILASGASDMALFTYANGPEPDDQYGLFHSSQIPDATSPDLGNYGRLNDPFIDQALTQGRTTVVFGERLAAYHRLLRRLTEQVYLIPLYTDVNIMLVNERVQNVLPHANAAMNMWNIGDWWISISQVS
jgi:peptide/nickel transport system substrate-binding protein